MTSTYAVAPADLIDVVAVIVPGPTGPQGPPGVGAGTIAVGATPVTGGTATFLLSTDGSKVTLTDPATVGGGGYYPPLVVTDTGAVIVSDTGSTMIFWA